MSETETGHGASIRKRPMQKRAQERVERILAVATQMIAEAGSDQLKMSDVAARAGISIGSLYQYFPDKAAIVRTLAEHYNEAGRDCICQGLDGVSSPSELEQAFTELIDEYYAMFLSEPVMRDIWSGTQADKALCDLDLEDARANAQELAAAMLRAKPAREPDATASTALLIIHLGEATMRLAIQMPEAEGRRLVDDYKRMALRELLD
ncbi:TetR/AcrR family transcriptional regulator [Nitratireductor sp. OM-1]|uniref:TetR/AcrR family transcriptional regulator n=1 Tax=Nitratireductor TaxID=245876 RepID=UPI000DE124B8|nr:TetR/AcrR family transcriptional regulator [Nitratireductor sp. OM-1]